MAQGTTIAEMLANLASSKAAIIAALKAKGVTVPDGAKFEDLSALVAQVEGGGSVDVSEYLIAWEENRDEITDLTIPDGVTMIGNYAFYSCVELQGLEIPDGVISIGGAAFADCTSLVFLYIPPSVKSIGENAFAGCPSTCKIVFDMRYDELIGMSGYPFGLEPGTPFQCSDGDYEV